MAYPTTADFRAWQQQRRAQGLDPNDAIAWSTYAIATFGSDFIVDGPAPGGTVAPNVTPQPNVGTTPGGAAGAIDLRPYDPQGVHTMKPFEFYNTFMDSDDAAGRHYSGPMLGQPKSQLDWIGGRPAGYFWTPAEGKLHIPFRRAESVRDGIAESPDLDPVWQQGYIELMNDPRIVAAVLTIDKLYGLRHIPAFNGEQARQELGREDPRFQDPAFRVATFLMWTALRGPFQVEANAGRPGTFTNPNKILDPIEFMYDRGFWARPTDPNDYYSRPHRVFDSGDQGQGLNDERLRAWQIQTGIANNPAWHEDTRTGTPPQPGTPAMGAGAVGTASAGTPATPMTAMGMSAPSTAAPMAPLATPGVVSGHLVDMPGGGTGGIGSGYRLKQRYLESGWTDHGDGTATSPDGRRLYIGMSGDPTYEVQAATPLTPGAPPTFGAPATPGAPDASAPSVTAYNSGSPWDYTQVPPSLVPYLLTAEQAAAELQLEWEKYRSIQLPNAQMSWLLAQKELELKQRMSDLEWAKFEVYKQDLERQWGLKIAQLDLETSTAAGYVGTPWTDQQIDSLYQTIMQQATASGQYQRPSRSQWVTWAQAGGVRPDQANQLADLVYNFAQENGRGPTQEEFRNLARSINLGVTPTLQAEIQRGYLDLQRQAEERAQRQAELQRTNLLAQLYANPRNINQAAYLNQIAPHFVRGTSTDRIFEQVARSGPSSQQQAAQQQPTQPTQPTQPDQTVQQQAVPSIAPSQFYQQISSAFGVGTPQYQRPTQQQWAAKAQELGMPQQFASTFSKAWYDWVNSGRSADEQAFNQVAFIHGWGQAPQQPTQQQASTFGSSFSGVV